METQVQLREGLVSIPYPVESLRFADEKDLLDDESIPLRIYYD